MLAGSLISWMVNLATKNLWFDCFLWRQEKFYAYKPETIDHLKANIRGAIAEIRLHKMEKVHQNWSDRMRFCEASRDIVTSQHKIDFYQNFQNVFYLSFDY